MLLLSLLISLLIVNNLNAFQTSLFHNRNIRVKNNKINQFLNDKSLHKQSNIAMSLGGDIKQVSVGTYLAERIAQAGAKHFFTVPGDFTLLLLDELLKHPDLTMVGCCNELVGTLFSIDIIVVYSS